MVPFIVMLMPVSGCVTSTTYASVQEAMKGSPELLEKATNDCVDVYRGSARDREFLSKLVRAPNDKNLPRLMCSRLYKAMAAGRITYDDFQSMSSGQVRPVVIRVLQNR